MWLTEVFIYLRMIIGQKRFMFYTVTSGATNLTKVGLFDVGWYNIWYKKYFSFLKVVI